MDWSAAETRVASGKGNQTIIGVKKTVAEGQKRKADADPDVSSAHKDKKTRRGSGKKPKK